jgi:hypothetical protein
MGRRESWRLILDGRIREGVREGRRDGVGLDSWASRLVQSVVGLVALGAASVWSFKNNDPLVTVVLLVGVVSMLVIAIQLAWLLLRRR